MTQEKDKAADVLCISAGSDEASLVSSGKPEFAAPRLTGKRTGMVVFSPYPADPRPRRAVDALLKEGMAVDLICEGEQGFPSRERRGALNVTRIPLRHFRGGALSYAYQYSVFILASAAILAWRTLRRRYDLIYVHNMPDILVVSSILPKLFGAKVILDQHDPMPELMETIFHKDASSFPVRVLRWQEKFSFALADQVITVNAACKRIFSQRSCKPEKIGIVMNAPDENIFPYRPAESYPPRDKAAPFVIMYHGSLVERNGLGLAVEALALANLPNAELRIFGKKSPYLEQVLERVEELNLDKQVRYFGSRTLEELVQEIEACDVGIIPNQQNRFTEINTPTRIFEYLALGKPVIAPKTTGILDYFGAESLFFFESGDVKDLAEAMAFVAFHPAGAQHVAEMGQRVYLRHEWKDERESLVNLVTNSLGS